MISSSQFISCVGIHSRIFLKQNIFDHFDSALIVQYLSAIHIVHGISINVIFLNPFQPNILFRDPIKTPETLSFPDVYRG